jgi:uroporphyrin-III C-methyltransferase/precorrin-2 dehydrogenase/sirohydrochlorin ferrochelatase
LSNQTPKLNTFPVFFGVNGRRVVIFGGGDEALAKARLVAQSNAEVIISASKPGMALAEWARSNSVYIDTVTSAKSLIHGAALVFSATADERTDRAMVSLARSAGVPVNAVDRPELCDFYTPDRSLLRCFAHRSSACCRSRSDGWPLLLLPIVEPRKN